MRAGDLAKLYLTLAKKLFMTKLSYVGLVVHGLGFSHHIYAFKYILSDVDYSKTTDQRVLEMEDFGPRYITSWNLIIQTIYLFMAICVDLAEIKPPSKPRAIFTDAMKKYRGYLYNVIMFPTTLFVALMFWTLFWINREWVLPEAADVIAPKWLNHSIHTNILLVLFAELFLTKRGLPKPEFKMAVAILTVFGFVYYVQFLLTYYQLGRWIYGIFYDLSWTQRFFFIGFMHMASIAFLKIGFAIQSYKNAQLKFS